MNLAIIPARGGSRRIPGKNVRPFHGKPIIAYSIEAAKASGIFSKVVVSTDDARIQAVARYYGASIHTRARRLAEDIIGTQEVTRAVLKWWTGCAVASHLQPTAVCCIYATAPMLTPQDLVHGLAMLENREYAYQDGIYYWGRAEAFANGVPLTEGLRIESDDPRFIDINTEEDWERAERTYEALHQKAAA